MSRLELKSPSAAQKAADGLLQEMSRRLASGLLGLCPVDTALSLVTLCHTQSCGKCVPCRVGLSQLKNLLSDILEGRATEETIGLIESTAQVIYDSADCAIGYETARMVMSSVRAFRDDFEEHVRNHRCLGSFSGSVPCVSLCPAGVDIPGYIALVNEGRSEDAMRLIRKDNPFPLPAGIFASIPVRRIAAGICWITPLIYARSSVMPQIRPGTFPCPFAPPPPVRLWLSSAAGHAGFPRPITLR